MRELNFIDICRNLEAEKTDILNGHYPRIEARKDSYFVKELLCDDTKVSALMKLIDEYFNLKLWSDLGAKPNKHWMVSDAKKYFQLRGHRHKMLVQFEFIKDEIFAAFPSCVDLEELLTIHRDRRERGKFRRIAIDYNRA